MAVDFCAPISLSEADNNSSTDEISERETFFDDIAHVLQNTKKEYQL